MKIRTVNIISNNRMFKYLILTIFYLFIINYIFDATNKQKKNCFEYSNKTNIYYKEFFQSPEIKSQIYKKNLTFIETISGGKGNVGNALVMLNKLINICEIIKCKNIIVPRGGLEKIIKKPIFYKDYNIKIFPYSYKKNLTIDINLNTKYIFYFNFKNKEYKNRIGIIKKEVLNNIPKYISSPDDLYIHIRSGDIFVNIINKNYAQPPLCFYQKIINENNFNKIYIVSNGHENPVINKLLYLYQKIKYIHNSVERDISIIISAYNLVISVSTFIYTLINLNDNKQNLYIYKYDKYHLNNLNCVVHEMEASIKYKSIMFGKWNNTKEQLDLMLKEDCLKSNLTIFISHSHEKDKVKKKCI